MVRASEEVSERTQVGNILKKKSSSHFLLSCPLLLVSFPLKSFSGFNLDFDPSEASSVGICEPDISFDKTPF